ncbi:MAG: GNAT family N-acetyltransferase [Lentilitoribacter sp.]
MKLTTRFDPDDKLDNEIIGKTRSYNAKFTPDDYKPFSVYLTNDDGQLMGGMTAFLSWSYLEIKYLWVDEAHRGKGHAAEIMNAGEIAARENKCEYALVDTFEFQALDFYLKQEYQLVAEIDGYLGKYKRYFLQKKL